LNLDETFEHFPYKADDSVIYTLRQAVTDVVAAINYKIQNAPPQATIKGCRRAFFNMNECNNALHDEETEHAQCLYRLADYGRYAGLAKASKPSFEMSIEEQGQYLWLDRIALALVRTGHLGYFNRKGYADYILQA
jgi:hypothetical protein